MLATAIFQCHQAPIIARREFFGHLLDFDQSNFAAFILHRTYPNSSGNHSRASSLTEDNEYMHMHPAGGYHAPSAHDDYTNMHPPTGDMSSATSSCSITSGTPSTDIRFSEYHLEKVHAHFTPSEDDELLTRPPRTWSVGSKLEHSKRKHHTDRVTNEIHNSRLRAYSVGSRIMKNSNVRMEEASGSHSGSSTPSHNSPVAMNHHEINNNTRAVSNNKNKKSSSAPILAQPFAGRTSHGSVDHMDDLMEIDYSNRSGAESGGSNLMEIDYSNRNNSSGFSYKSSPVNIPNKSNEDYAIKTNTPSNYVDMRPGCVRRATLEQNEGDYMDMSKSSVTSRGSSSSTPLSSSPLKARTNPLMPPPFQNSNYVDMSPRSYDIHVRARGRIASKSLTKEYPKQSSVPDGYLEMSFKKPSSSASISANSQSNENPSSSSDEYINMDFSNNNEIMNSSGSNSSMTSKPITIQKRHINDKIVKSGSPPAFLPLNNQMTASISPTRSTNRTRCDSRDSGIVTPSSGSQATIFPFSPGSPMKQFDPHDDLQRRLNDDDVIEEEPRTPVPMGISNVETLSCDYAVMNLGEPVSKKPNLAATPVQTKSPSSSHFLLETDSENHDYINCTPISMGANQPLQPQSRLVTPKPINLASSSPESGDYALMNPVKASAALSPDPCSSADTPPKTSSKKSVLLSLSSHEKLNNSNSCFKPIVEDSHHSHHQFQRHSSDRGYTSTSNETSHDVRPNSVNSEKIKSATVMSGFLSNRPSSANSERMPLHRSTSSSTSTLCESQTSSSQTLRNLDASSSVPSPMSLTSRPESVSSDIHMASRPPSVTSERELHYASLDLPPCSSSNPHNQPQKMDVDQKMDSTSPNSNQNSSSSSSSSVSSQQSQSVFTYAQIDFNKSAQQQQHHQSSGGKK